MFRVCLRISWLGVGTPKRETEMFVREDGTSCAPLIFRVLLTLPDLKCHPMACKLASEVFVMRSVDPSFL